MKDIRWNLPIVIDFETYYDREYSLSKITTEEYIRCDKFECIGVSVKVGSNPTHFYPLETGIPFIKNIVENTYPNSPVISHNNTFDMGILGLRYDIHPNFMVDTAIMAKVSAFDRVAGGTNLAKLSDKLCEMGIVTQMKGTTVHNMLGVHAKDMTQRQWHEYSEYCKLDTELCYALYMYLLPFVPKSELVMADITTKMWTKPVFDLDVPLLTKYADHLAREKQMMLSKLAIQMGYNDTEKLLTDIRSKTKFVDILGRFVTVPTKISERTGKVAPATAKTDLEFMALLEHDDPVIRTLVETKLGVSSTNEETRTGRFLSLASRGLMPIPLRYASAHTGRYGGCFAPETMVCLKSKNPFDRSPYYANIVDATPDTLIWNGEEFVEHDGVICNGVQEVINYDGLCGTRGHKVFTKDGLVSLEYARDNGLPIIDCPLPSTTTIHPIQGTRPPMQYADGAVVPVYDILNAGKDHKYMANGKLVHNSDKINVQNLGKRSKEPILRQSMRAKQGHLVIGTDSSNIEVRVLSFLADQQDVIDVFRSGRDVYIDMATKIYNKSYDEIYEVSKRNPTKEGKLMRNIAKAVVLGCVGKGTEVLTLRGWVAIQYVQDDDLLWDGESWVSHGGVVPMGEKDCYNVNTIYLTADHKVYDGTQWKSFDTLTDGDGTQEYGYWWYATAENWAITNLPNKVVEDWEHDGTTGKAWCIPDTNDADIGESWKDACLFEPTQTYDILEVGEHNRFFVRSAYSDVSKPTYLCVHNCGYGASAAKFAELMKQQGLAEQADMADTLINTYRSSNNKVSEFWNTTQQALEVMVMGGDMWFGGADGKLLYADGRSKFHGVVIPSIKFPDGTYLYYQGLRHEVDETGRIGLVYDQFKGRNWVTTRLWGSKAVENITQKLAFDILKYQAIKITERGVPVNLNVHDEWVSVVPVEHAPHAIKAHAECMRKVPEYIPDGLLDCEVDVGWNYGTTNTLPI